MIGAYRLSCSLLAAVCLFLAAAGSAKADLLGSSLVDPRGGIFYPAQQDHDDAREAVRSGEILPLEAVMSQVRRSHTGELLDAQLNRRGGQATYEIKLLTPGGEVVLVTADARSGRVLGTRRGR